MGMFDSLTDFAAAVVASPVTLAAKAVEVTVDVVAAVPDVAEKAIENIEQAVDKIGK